MSDNLKAALLTGALSGCVGLVGWLMYTLATINTRLFLIGELTLFTCVTVTFAFCRIRADLRAEKSTESPRRPPSSARS